MLLVRKVNLCYVKFKFADLPILKDAFVENSQRDFHGLDFILGQSPGLEEEVLAPIQAIIVIY